MNIETSWDDGTRGDLKLAELLNRYDLPGTFYIPGTTELSDSEIRQLNDRFEIGNHSFSHPPDLKRLNNEEIERQIYLAEYSLLEITGKKPTKFCYPRGKYDNRAIEILKKRGYHSARTTDVGYFYSDNQFRTRTTVHCAPRLEYNGVDWLAYGLRKLNEAAEKNGTFHVWGHSLELTKIDGWRKLKMLFTEMRNYL